MLNCVLDKTRAPTRLLLSPALASVITQRLNLQQDYCVHLGKFDYYLNTAHAVHNHGEVSLMLDSRQIFDYSFRMENCFLLNSF